jgi:cytochrome b6-f complex iron-sulfur subunit
MGKTSQNPISRHEFLRKLGFGGASLMAVYCAVSLVSSCSTLKPEGSAEDFILDLSKGKFRSLLQTGAWMKINNVVIACTETGQYAAVSSICSHEGENRIEYRSGEKDFRCSAHGAEFDLSGNGKNKKGRKGLAVFQTRLDGSRLRVFLPSKS